MNKKSKGYIITYRSNEHYEVLGWVKAASASQALEKARRELKKEIERYGVINATLGEWQGVQNVRFNEP